MRKIWKLALMLAVITASYLVGQRSEIKEEGVTDQVINDIDIAVSRRQIIDSLQELNTQKVVQKIDSTKKVYSRRITSLNREIKELKSSLVGQLSEYEADTTSQTPECDSIIQTYGELTDSLETKIVFHIGVTNLLQERIVLQDSMIYSKSSMLKESYDNIEVLKKQFQKKDTWWSRNQKWIYFIGGMAGTALILK